MRWKKLKVGKLAAEHIIQWIMQLNMWRLQMVMLFSNHYPINLESNIEPTWPAFLIDLFTSRIWSKELLKKLPDPGMKKSRQIGHCLKVERATLLVT